MDRHRCKLCWRRFGSGRALGGHMRSHVMNPNSMHSNIEIPHQSDTDSGNFEDEMEEEVDEGSLTESVIVHDRDSESETSKRVLNTGRRSKRLRPTSEPSGFEPKEKRLKCEANWSESWTELDQGSSLSDSTVEEVAFCLMMLSRDKWDTLKNDHNNAVISEGAGADSENNMKRFSEDDTRVENKYKCEKCSKRFSSYQALGGHKASHNKLRLAPNPNTLLDLKNPTRSTEQRLHQCPICYRVFPSGQALGGHKRSHANMVMVPERAPGRFGDVVIDLNFPAPGDENVGAF